MTMLPFVAAQVLVDIDLFRRVVAFQRGLEMPLFDFWRTHKPDDVPLRLTPATTITLVQLLTTHGTPELFDLAKQATFSCLRSMGKEPEVGSLPLLYVADSALRANRADILEWALATKTAKVDGRPRDAWHEVIKRFTDDEGPRMLDVLKKHMPLPTRKLNALVTNRAFSIAHLSLLRWLIKEIPNIEMPREMVKSAANRGDLPMLQFLHDHGVRTRHALVYNDVFSNALYTRRFDVLAFFLEHYTESLHGSNLLNLALDTHPEAQQLAVRFAKSLQAGCAMYISEDSNDSHLATVKDWATRGLISPRWPISIDAAAANGSLGTVRFLHEQGIATATTRAMDRAAAESHLRVVQFLHDHRTEGCTFAAVRQALEEDYFPIVRFLVDKCRDLFNHDAFNEALVAEAVRFALACDQLNDVAFLFEHFPHLFTRELLPDLLLHGAFDVYATLQSQFPDGADAVLNSTLYEAGRTMELGTIRFVVNVLGRRDLAYRAIDGAASMSTCGAHWVRAVHAVTPTTAIRRTPTRLRGCSALKTRVPRRCALAMWRYFSG